MATHEQYILHVTAGATYDTKKHQDVRVNSEIPVDISSDLLDARVHMRIKDYRGMLPSSSHHLSSLMPLQHPSPPSAHRLPSTAHPLTHRRSTRRLPQNLTLLLDAPTPVRPLLHLLLLHAETRHRRRQARFWKRLRPPDSRPLTAAVR
jgi:hypothetical protein